MARLWKNRENGTGKNGKFVPNCLIFLRFFSNFLRISHMFPTLPLGIFSIFSHFPISPQSPPTISPDFPPFSPISSHFPPFLHFPHFSLPLPLVGYSAAANADAWNQAIA